MLCSVALFNASQDYNDWEGLVKLSKPSTILRTGVTGISQTTRRIIHPKIHFSIRPDFEHKVKIFSEIFRSFVWLGAITGQNSLQFFFLTRPDYGSAQTDPLVSTTSLSFLRHRLRYPVSGAGGGNHNRRIRSRIALNT